MSLIKVNILKKVAADAANFKLKDLVTVTKGDYAGFRGEVISLPAQNNERKYIVRGYGRIVYVRAEEMRHLNNPNGDSAAQDAGAFPLAEKASRIVKGIMSQVKRVEDEAEAAFRNAKTAEEKNAAQRDAVAIHNIMEKLEIAASYA